MADITGTIYGTTSNPDISAKIVWSETVDVAENTGTVTAALYLYKNCNYANRTRSNYSDFELMFTTGTNPIRVWEGSNPSVDDTSVELWSGAGWVKCIENVLSGFAHNADGTGTVRISASGAMGGTSVTSIDCGATVTLFPIPRASTATVTPSVDVNGSNQVTANIVSKSSAYTHTVQFYVGADYASATYKTEITGAYTRGSYTIPTSWRLSMPTTTSATAKARIITYNGAAQVGDPYVTEFTITVPTSVRPVVDASNVTLAAVQADETEGFVSYVAGYSACGATFGSLANDFQSEVAISSYYIQFGAAVTSTAPYNTATFAASGAYTITVGVTDARGRTGVYSSVITVQPYGEPTVAGFLMGRCDSAGVPSDTGGYVFATGTAILASCGGENSIVNLRACFKTVAATSYGAWETLTYNPSTLALALEDPLAWSLLSTVSYDIKAEITDDLGNGTSYAFRIPTADVALNFKDGGKGAAFFKYAETDGLLEVDGDFKADAGTFTGALGAASATFTTPLPLSSGGTNSITPGGIVDEIKTPLVNLLYPVGSIYLSVASTSPATLFGGTWEQIQDKFLLAAGTTYAAAATGGAATHTLTVDEIPAHNHRYLRAKILAAETVSPDTGTAYMGSSIESGKTEPYTYNTGGGLAHNNMPPYLAVYVWKRTA